MKLYFSPGACSMSVRILLHEIGKDVEYIPVDLKTKKTANGDDFKKINPKGAVPVLVTDKNEVLTENTAIHQYLADTNKATTLLPPVGDIARYRVLELSSYLCSDVHKSFGALFSKDIPDDLKNKIFIPLLKMKLDYLNTVLQNKKFLTNEQFTIADAYLFVMLTWIKHFHIELDQWPALASYFLELKKRKSIQQALEEESH